MKRSTKSQEVEKHRHPLFLGDPVAIVADGETGSGTAPARPLLIAAWSDDEGRLVSVEELGQFLAAHGNAKIFCHDAASLHWLLFAALSDLGDRRGIEELWRASEECRVIDVMLLGQRIQLCEGVFSPPRPLPRLVADFESDGVKDNWRGHSSLIEELQQRFSMHAAEPDQASRRQAATDLVKIVFRISRKMASEAYSAAKVREIPRSTIKKYGPLGLGIDVQAAIALRRTEQLGLFSPCQQLEDISRTAEERYCQASESLHKHRQFRDCFGWDKTKVVERDRKGFVDSKSKLAHCLDRCHKLLQDSFGRPIPRPLTANRKLSPVPEHWGLCLYGNEELQAWAQLMQSAETSRAVRAAAAQDGLKPQYEIIPQLISRRPNLDFTQSLGDRFFLPRDGFVFVVVTTRNLAYRCFAAALSQHRRGRLYDLLKVGEDLTRFLAFALAQVAPIRALVGDCGDWAGFAPTPQLLDLAEMILKSMMSGLSFSAAAAMLNQHDKWKFLASDLRRLYYKATDSLPELGLLWNSTEEPTDSDWLLDRPITPMGGVGGPVYDTQRRNKQCMLWADEIRKAMVYAFVKENLRLVGVAGTEMVLEVPCENQEAIVELARELGVNAATPSLGELASHCCTCRTANSW